MKADRLIRMLLLLQNHGKRTTRELAAQLEVSDRTITRDMEALSAAGIPVYAERGPQGGWRLLEGYRSQLTGMTQQELLSLLLVEPSGSLAELGIGGDFEAAFQKVLAVSPESLRSYAEAVKDRIHIDGSAWFESLEPVPFLPVLQEAVWSCRMIDIAYLPVQRGGVPVDAGSADSQAEPDLYNAVVAPYGLVAKRNVWYLVAGGDESVFYRVSRLRSVRLLADTFERPPGFELARSWERATRSFMADRLSCRVRLRLREDMLPYLPSERQARMLGSLPLTEGWIEAELEFRSLEAARSSLFSLGPKAEVLEPEALRTWLLDTAGAIMALYGSRQTSGDNRA